MNFYTRAIDKFVKKVGEHNLPYVYLVIFLAFLAGVALTVNYGVQRMDAHYEKQFQVFENNIKELENISKDLDQIGTDFEKIKANTKLIQRNMIELKNKAEEIRKQAKELENDKSR